MTKSPSPSVDEVADLATKYANFDAREAMASAVIGGNAAALAALSLDIRRLVASLVSLSKAGSGEPSSVDQRAAMKETVRQITGMLEWGDVPLSAAEVKLVEHIKGMPARMTDEFSEAKLGRWLGWVQGAACARGWLLLDDCKRINKSFSATPNHEARGDGVRVTDGQVEAAFQVLWPVVEWDTETECRRFVRAALEAALPPLGDGRAEIVEGDWRPWSGGKQPVPDATLVDYRLRRDEPGQFGTNTADVLFWHHDGRGDDLVAWRPAALSSPGGRE